MLGKDFYVKVFDKKNPLTKPSFRFHRVRDKERFKAALTKQLETHNKKEGTNLTFEPVSYIEYRKGQ